MKYIVDYSITQSAYWKHIATKSYAPSSSPIQFYFAIEDLNDIGKYINDIVRICLLATGKGKVKGQEGDKGWS